MAKTDIKSAFRIIPLHPDDHPLLGMKWENLYYYDRCPPMGCSSSCAIFEAFSTALEWIAIHRLGASSVLHILDDFLFIVDTKQKCQSAVNNFLCMGQVIGVLIAEEKTVGPDTSLQFVGIKLDSVLQEARLPEDKLHKCHTPLTSFLLSSEGDSQRAPIAHWPFEFYLLAQLFCRAKLFFVILSILR